MAAWPAQRAARLLALCGLLGRGAAPAADVASAPDGEAWKACGSVSYKILHGASPIFLFRNATTPHQAARLRALALPRLLPSLAESGRANQRTSRTTFFNVVDEEGYERVEQHLLGSGLAPRADMLPEARQLVSQMQLVQWEMLRCARESQAWPLMEPYVDSITEESFRPEGLQVARYLRGQYYGPHLDDFKDADGLDEMGRVATLLLYLSTPDAGGHTVFPALRPRSGGPEGPRAAPPAESQPGSDERRRCDFAGAVRICPQHRCEAVVASNRSCTAFCTENGLACAGAWRAHTSGDPCSRGGLDAPTVSASLTCDDSHAREVGNQEMVCHCGPHSDVHEVPWSKREAPACAHGFRELHPAAPAGLELCCAHDVLRVEASEGDALLFFPRHSFAGHASTPAHPQQLLWHVACPVEEGEKWVAQQWLVNRTKPWTPRRPPPQDSRLHKPRKRAEL